MRSDLIRIRTISKRTGQYRFILESRIFKKDQFITCTKSILVNILLFISPFCFGQGYDGLIIETSKVDKNNAVYTLGKEFTFEIEILSNGQKYYFNPMKDTLSADLKGESFVCLTVINPKLFSRTNRNQTEIVYSYPSNSQMASSTGLVENDQNIWIHPIRQGFLKSLETCPFPYLKFDVPNNYEWHDHMLVSEYWANPNWGEWTGNLKIDYHYKIEGIESISSSFGTIECLKIYATGQSEIGETILESYYSKTYGFVRLKYTLANGIRIHFELKSVTEGEIYRDIESLLRSKHR